jgi:hypothetical protein
VCRRDLGDRRRQADKQQRAERTSGLAPLGAAPDPWHSRPVRANLCCLLCLLRERSIWADYRLLHANPRFDLRRTPVRNFGLPPGRFRRLPDQLLALGQRRRASQRGRARRSTRIIRFVSAPPPPRRVCFRTAGTDRARPQRSTDDRHRLVGCSAHRRKWMCCCKTRICGGLHGTPPQAEKRRRPIGHAGIATHGFIRSYECAKWLAVPRRFLLCRGALMPRRP